MNEEDSKVLHRYLSDVQSLYQEISTWISNKPLRMQEEEIVIHERASGEYTTRKLIILDDNDNRIAEVVPIGAWIIGANGRVDLIGKLDNAIIIDLEKGGPTYLYKGVVDHEGWYWVENTRLSRLYALDQNLFFDLLAEVSDYEV